MYTCSRQGEKRWVRKKGYWRLEGGTIQTEGNRAEGGRDDASRTSLPTRSSFPCLRWTTSTRIVSNASRFEIDKERERRKERREGREEEERGEKRKKGEEEEVPSRRYVRYFVRGRVCGSEISRGPSSTLRPVFRAFANLHLPSGYTSLPSGRPSQLHGSPSFPREPRVHEMQPIFPSALA